MGNYTTQIRFICESKSGLTESVGFNGIMNAINNSVDDIFNFEWPIFDEEYRVPLEVKILRHFYTREIGEETFGLWQLRLCDRLNVIMPYYNQLYKSELIKFNPMYDIDLTTNHAKANDGLVNKNENSIYSQSNNTTRNADINTIDDGSSDTDFVGKKVGSSSVNQIEENNISNNDTSTESSNSNDKNWSTNLTSNNAEDNVTRSDKNVNRYSDTPQGNVNIGGGPNDGNPSVDSVFGNGYLTNVTIVDDENKENSKNKSETISDNSTEGIANQTINRSSGGSSKADRSSSGVEDRTDDERNTTKNYTSNIRNSNEKEKIVGSGEHTNNVTGRVSSMNTEDFIQNIVGKRGGITYSKMLNEFRETFLNIDRMILKDLDSLFISLWE